MVTKLDVLRTLLSLHALLVSCSVMLLWLSVLSKGLLYRL